MDGRKTGLDSRLLCRNLGSFVLAMLNSWPAVWLVLGLHLVVLVVQVVQWVWWG